jgi:hypothetical protein
MVATITVGNGIILIEWLGVRSSIGCIGGMGNRGSCGVSRATTVRCIPRIAIVRRRRSGRCRSCRMDTIG